MDLRLDEIWREMKISKWMSGLAEKYKPQTILIKNARIVTEEQFNTGENYSILIENGRIKEIKQSIDHRAEVIIDATGKFVLPGLIDMHIHTRGSNAHHLLNLLQGITATREMGGFPWILNRKNMVENHTFLGPRMTVAGTMLNYRPFYQFTRVVRTPEEVDAVISEQIDAGYDLIKIWNHMPLELVQRISEKCHKEGIDFAGHIPNEITVQQAVDLGFRTLEHLKGYIIDSGVVLTEEDYVKSTPKSGIWNCPTFVVFYYESLLGQVAAAELERMPENEYISPYIRDLWYTELERRQQEVSEIGRNIPLDHLNLQRKIFSDLMEIDAPYIVGTDFGGGYPLCLPGFGMLREIQFMHDTFDIPYSELISHSTQESALVLRKEEELGTVKVGSYADLLIVADDPSVHGIPLDGKFGVISAGRYFSASDREELLSQLVEFNTNELDIGEDEALDELLSYYFDNRNQGMLKPTFVSIFSSYLQDIGKYEEAVKIAAINLDLSGTYYDYFSIGELYQEQGNMDLAKKMWERSLDLNPYFDHLNKKVKELNN